jgi:hypothetical protein
VEASKLWEEVIKGQIRAHARYMHPGSIGKSNLAMLWLSRADGENLEEEKTKRQISGHYLHLQ